MRTERGKGHRERRKRKERGKVTKHKGRQKEGERRTEETKNN
jgi:hypothetical protein